MRPVFLIGYMGCGKSTLGKALAEWLDVQFIDLDDYIEERYESTINGIFAAAGAAKFREIEHQALREVAAADNAVISCGGGTPCFADNMHLVNEEVTDVALDCMKTLNLGNRGQLDMLNIGLSAVPYGGVGKGDGRIELQDTYLRLDRQIDRLLSAIDKGVGLGNAVVFVASAGEFEGNRTVDPKFNIPTGEFRPDRAKSLLNMYLMAVYGNGNWVDGYYDQNFYLNRKLIKEKNIAAADV